MTSTGYELRELRAGFDALSEAGDSVHRLFADGRTKYVGLNGLPDEIDELTARLTCFALRTNQPVLVVLPDTEPRRPPLLFATALVTYALRRIQAERVGRCVLYVSNSPTVRSQLGMVQIAYLRLDSVFPQKYASRGANVLKTVNAGETKQVPAGVFLPEVLSICAPADPDVLLNRYQPSWVAVDCSGRPEIPWLAGLVSECRRRDIPVVGWTDLHFGTAIDIWTELGGGLFQWPLTRVDLGRALHNLDDLQPLALHSTLLPRVLVGESVTSISAKLADAGDLLISAGRFRNGRLSADALLLGWRYLRALEGLVVPLPIHEAEADAYWGVTQIGTLRNALSRFIDAVQAVSQDVSSLIGDAANLLDAAKAEIDKAGSPLWQGLANFCVESNLPRTLVFQSKSRREMFAFALLAQFNITEAELGDIGIRLTHVNDRVTSEDRSATVPALIGLPSRYTEHRLDGLFSAGGLEVFLWPHHLPILTRRAAQWDEAIVLRTKGLNSFPFSDTLRSGKDSQPKNLVIKPPQPLPADSRGEHPTLRASVALWKRPDAVEAIANLLEIADELDEGKSPSIATNLDDIQSPPIDTEPIVEQAIEIVAVGNWRVLFATDEAVNVITKTNEGRPSVERRYARALRPADDILFIEGQRRQNLYDLIVSRVHRDPVYAGYIALVERWHDELLRAYSNSRPIALTPELFLRELQRAGSALTSSQAIRFWLQGDVLAPIDAEDLRRAGQILSIDFVIEHYRQIHRGARKLAGLHRSLSLRLNNWLASEGLESMTAGPEDPIDTDLGLSIADFRDSLIRLHVLAANVVNGPFLRAHLGSLERS